MSKEDFDRVLSAIPGLGIRKWDDEDVQMLFKILYWSALRFNEGLKLSFEDLDIGRAEWRLGKTKTEKYGVAVIGNPFIEELIDWAVSKGPGRFFPGLSYNTAVRWLYKLGVELNIPSWVIPQSESGEKTLSHIFRKSLAKDMMMGTYGKKADIGIVAKQLRHGNIATTEKYLKASNEAVKDFWD